MPGTLRPPMLHGRFRMQPSPRRLLSSRKVYEGRIWDVVSDSFQLNDDGDALVRDYIDHPGAVAVLPMNDAGEVLLIKQYRHPVGMDLWEIPAGLLDVEGEDFVVGAARELAEEADLVAGRWNVLADFFNSPGSSSEAIRIYLARGLSEVPAPRTARPHRRGSRNRAALDPARRRRRGRAGRAACTTRPPSSESSPPRPPAPTASQGLRPADAPWPAHPSQR